MNPELVVAALFAIIPLVALGQRFGIPYPIVLVLCGVLISLYPAFPGYELAPALVLTVFLPPLLYWDAVAAPMEDMRRDAGWVLALSVTVVLLTIVAVAVAVKAIEPGVPWSIAIVLGAIVAPTDCVAFANLAAHLPIPRRVVAIVQGESLFNDALSLIVYRAALAVAVAGTFTPGQDFGKLLFAAVGSIAYGLLVGYLATWLWTRLHDTDIQTAVAVIVPFLAYIPADRLGLSGVLAVVTTGMVAARTTPKVMTYTTRLRFAGVASTGSFLINAIVFLLVGLQLRVVAEDPARRSPAVLLRDMVVVNIVILAVRFAWVFGRGLVLRYRGHYLRPSELAVISWSGFRGSVSLAAALAIPYYLDDGSPFADRHFIVFITFSVIVVTLVGQGLTLPLLLRWFGFKEEPDGDEARVLRVLAHVALDTVDRMEKAETASPAVIALLRRRYERLQETYVEADDVTGARAFTGEIGEATARVIRAQREALIGLRRRGELGNPVLQSVQRMLDLQEAEQDQVRSVVNATLSAVRMPPVHPDSRT